MTIQEAYKAVWAAHDRAWRSYEVAVQRARAGRGTWLEVERKKNRIMAIAAQADAIMRRYLKKN